MLSYVKINENLTEQNLLLFAAKHYDNPACLDLDEFSEDLNISSKIKKLLSKYKQTGDLKARLLINYFIMFFNVFDNEAATKILFLKITDERVRTLLKTVLVYLNRCPDFLLINGKFININTIKQDFAFLKLLEESI